MVGISGIVAAICIGLAGAVVADEQEWMVASNNLQKAYNAESNAKARYEAFATKAGEEGYKSVAVLFRAATNSAAIRAANIAAKIRKTGAEPQMLLDVYGVKSTRENLEACLKGQTSADDSMYPELAKQAEAFKDSEAATLFKSAHTAEVEYGKFFKAALGSLADWKELGKRFRVCQVCGYTVMGKAPATCPVCTAPQNKFILFSE
jgi:rubrerythrin